MMLPLSEIFILQRERKKKQTNKQQTNKQTKTAAVLNAMEKSSRLIIVQLNVYELICFKLGVMITTTKLYTFILFFVDFSLVFEGCS